MPLHLKLLTRLSQVWQGNTYTYSAVHQLISKNMPYGALAIVVH